MRWRACVAALCAGLAAACGGGDDLRDADPPPQRVTLSGTIMREAPLAGGVEAKPLQGVPTSVPTPVAGRYELIVERMGPPYALVNAGQGRLLSVATGPGVANITPLTHLVVAHLQGEDPTSYYDALGPFGGSDFSRLRPQQVAAAEAEVRRLLERRFGLATPAAVSSFITTPFEARAGDPMHDLVTRLFAGLAAAGVTFEDLVADVVARARQCEVESLAWRRDGGADDRLCPAGKSSQPDAADPAITVHEFADLQGDRLVVRERDAAVLDVQLDVPGAAPAGCSGAACTGVALGTGPDGARTIGFSATPLQGAAGAVALEGRLVAGNGAVDAGCAGTRITVDFAAAGTREVECVGRRLTTRLFERVSYAFAGKVDTTRLFDVRVDPDGRVAWVAVTRTGGGVEYRCRMAGCTAVTVGAADARGVRRIVFDGTVLERALGGGAVDPADTAVLRGEAFTRPPAPPESAACGLPVALRITAHDGTSSGLCDLNPGSSIGAEDLDGDGINETFSTSSGDLAGRTLSVAYDNARGQGVSASLTLPFIEATDPGFACADAACSGMSISRTVDGRFLFRLDGTLLTEVEPDGGAGERRIRLDGTVLSGRFDTGD